MVRFLIFKRFLNYIFHSSGYNYRELNYFTYSDAELADAVLKELPELEIYNSTFTNNFGDWALGFCAGIYGKDKPGNVDQADSPLQSVSTLDLSNRNIHNLINKVEPFPGLISNCFLCIFFPCLCFKSIDRRLECIFY